MPTVRTGLIACSLVAAASLVAPARSPTASAGRPVHPPLQTERTFRLAAGPGRRSFTLRERRGVILLDRVTVPRGVRLFVDAGIPGVAGARVWSWPRRDDPSLRCKRDRTAQVCTQSEEWCPMPPAVWHVRLVKLDGPAGSVRFDYVVAPPPAR
jgi:hypothetical protein